jgi:hypothetical protein
MPAAARYVIEQTTKEAKALETAFRAEIALRRTEINRAWDYYDGKMPEPLKPDKTRVNDNVQVNLIEQLIDKGASALMGTDEIGEIEGLEFQIASDKEAEDSIADEDSEESNPAQDYLDDLWRKNKKNILLHDIGVTGGIGGQMFVKIVPREGDIPRLVNLDPTNVSAFWDQDDKERVLWYRVQYAGAGQEIRQDIVRDLTAAGEDAGSWTIYYYTRTIPDSILSRFINDNPWKPSAEPERWPYEFAPIVDWKNLPRPTQYYGKNDIGQNWRLNDSFNFILSNLQRILKYHAKPILTFLGVQADNIKETAVDNAWAISDKDAKVQSLEMQADGMVPSITLAQLVKLAFFNSGRELDPGTVQDKLGDLTNFGLRVLYRDTLSKLTTKRLHYGDGLRRICQYCLEIAGYGAGIDVNVVWPDPLPHNPLETAQALQIDVQVGGISKRTYQERRGYDPEQEAERREQEQFEAQANQRANMGAQLVNQIMGNNGNGNQMQPGMTAGVGMGNGNRYGASPN